MRRKDRERDEGFAYGAIQACEYASLATVNEDGTPYCIPISPVVVGRDIYFHCAVQGKKLDNILRNSAVCLSAVGFSRTLSEKNTVAYESAVASGCCEVVSDETEKIQALKAVGEKYAGGYRENVENSIARHIHNTCVCKIVVEEITGKANPAQ